MPTPSPGLIAAVRDLPDGAQAVVEGTLTTPLGLLEDGRVAFLEDATGGIAIYLGMVPAAQLPAGRVLRVTGTVDERYGARTLRVPVDQVLALADGPLPGPLAVATGLVGEPVEGRRVSVTGLAVGTTTAYADGTGVLVDDGSGPVRVIVTADVLGALGISDIPAGALVMAAGPVGQRDSTGTGLAGYRIHAAVAGDLVIRPAGPEPSSPPASPSPSGSSAPSPSAPPSPGVSPAPSTSPTPTMSAAPSSAPPPSASPAPEPLAIGEARLRPLATTVLVAGVVTAEAGRLGAPALLAIEDVTAGLVVRLADGMARPARGTRLEVRGTLAAPYGQLELRVVTDGLRVVGAAAIPVPPVIRAAAVAEAVEGRLVTVVGMVAATPSRSASRDISFDIIDAEGGRLRVLADASSGVLATSVRAGQSYRLSGVAGQRASRKGALDGYRLWLRDELDITPVPAATSAGLAPAASAPPVTPIAAALAMQDLTVTVQGVVTIPAMLLDTTGRRVIIEDTTGAIEVLLPAGAVAPAPGARVRIQGLVGRAYGAPRLRAEAVEELAGRGVVEPVAAAGVLGEALEWRLVRMAGRVVAVTRLGSRWRAELEVGSERILVDGLPGAGIPSTSLVEGRPVRVTGIVRRPYPTASDQRFSLVPRWPADVSPAVADAAGSGTGPVAEPGGDGNDWSAPAGAAASALDVDVAALGDHAGELVRVGGLVVDATAAGFTLDDGTAIGAVQLDGEAAWYRGLLAPGDAVNAVGRVIAEGDLDGWLVLVTSPDGLIRVGDLGEPQPVDRPGLSDDGAEPVRDAAPEGTYLPAAGSWLGLGSLLPGGPGGAAGMLLAMLLSALSMGARLVRRHHARRRARARLVARLASVTNSCARAA